MSYEARSHGLVRKLTMPKYLGTITLLSGGIGVLEVVECSFVLKIISTAGNCGLTKMIGYMRVNMVSGWDTRAKVK